MPIRLKTSNEIEGLRAAGRLVAEAFAMLGERVQPGVSLRQLDDETARFLENRGAQPLYKGYQGRPPSRPPFPGVICASVNHEICHGLPDERTLRAGDIVGIDIGLKFNGFCGDACVTYAVGNVSAGAQRLMTVAQDCLSAGIAAAQPGRRLGDIGVAIQAHAEANGYSVVREWGGHGIGRDLHEDPSVPHVGPAEQGPVIREGMVFTIEPMINAGRHHWRELADGWTVVTADGKLSAQFEHTIAILHGGPQILTTL